MGNVLVTLTDKQRGIDAGSNGSLDYYLATVQTATHYYPFGWELVAMQYGAGYRYGFNGQEKDNETKSWAFKFRGEDPRKGRFDAVDPLAGKYPELSTYQFASNSPIWMLEIEGLEGIVYNLQGDYLGTNDKAKLAIYFMDDQNLKFSSHIPYMQEDNGAWHFDVDAFSEDDLKNISKFYIPSETIMQGKELVENQENKLNAIIHNNNLTASQKSEAVKYGATELAYVFYNNGNTKELFLEKITDDKRNYTSAWAAGVSFNYGKREQLLTDFKKKGLNIFMYGHLHGRFSPIGLVADINAKSDDLTKPSRPDDYIDPLFQDGEKHPMFLLSPNGFTIYSNQETDNDNLGQRFDYKGNLEKNYNENK